MLDPKLFDDLSRRVADNLPRGFQTLQGDLQRNLRGALEVGPGQAQPRHARGVRDTAGGVAAHPGKAQGARVCGWTSWSRPSARQRQSIHGTPVGAGHSDQGRSCHLQHFLPRCSRRQGAHCPGGNPSRQRAAVFQHRRPAGKGGPGEPRPGAQCARQQWIRVPGTADHRQSCPRRPAQAGQPVRSGDRRRHPDRERPVAGERGPGLRNDR